LAARSPSRLAAFLSCALLLPSCAPSDRASGPSGGRARGEALLLLTIDTLRADRLGCGGDVRARTPHLDRLARRGVQFARALSPVPLTLPGHATILTGRVPPDHGVRDNGLYRLADEVPLVTERFREAGWRTAAFLAAYPLASRFGLARGFEVYRDAPGVRAEGSAAPFAERPADEVNADVVAWLDGREDADPVFLWVHYFDPHAPYTAPRPCGRAAGGDAYRAEVLFTDRELGRLLRRLDDEFASVRVAAVADHGESLGEHGEDTHGIFVYEPTTRVPLILAGPGIEPAGAPIPTPVSLTGVAGTLLEWVGLDPGAAFEETLPRGPGAGADGPLYVESMYPRLRHGWASLRGFRGERWKVIRAPSPEVYDLVADPGERRNRWGDPDLPPEVERTFEALSAPRWADRPPARTAIDPEVEEALRSLGYAAVSPDAASPDDGAGRADPKDRVRIERMLGEAAVAIERGALPRARTYLTRALTIDPKNKETHVLLASLAAAEGDVSRAEGLLEWCLTVPPASLDPFVHFTAGRIAFDRGDWGAADERFGRAVASDPLDVVALYCWGLAAYRLERWGDAVERWRAALRLDPEHPPTRSVLPEAERRLAETRR
jgi:arylsulfatase A-like enzyme/Tfp pilus assembly protein PilF